MSDWISRAEAEAELTEMGFRQMAESKFGTHYTNAPVPDDDPNPDNVINVQFDRTMGALPRAEYLRQLQYQGVQHGQTR